MIKIGFFWKPCSICGSYEECKLSFIFIVVVCGVWSVSSGVQSEHNLQTLKFGLRLQMIGSLHNTSCYHASKLVSNCSYKEWIRCLSNEEMMYCHVIGRSKYVIMAPYQKINNVISFTSFCLNCTSLIIYITFL